MDTDKQMDDKQKLQIKHQSPREPGEIPPPNNYLNCTRWRRTTMPNIFGREVIDWTSVVRILEDAEA